MVDLALRAQFHRARTRWLGLALTRDLAWGLAFLLASGLLAFHLDCRFVLSPPIRLWWGIGSLAIAALLAAGWGWWSVRRQPDDRAVALGVERRHPQLRERLLSAVELARLPEAEQARYSAGLLAAVQAEAEAAAGGLDFRTAVTWEQAAPALVTCGLLAAVAALHVMLAPAAVAAWWGRMLRPGADIPVYRETRVRIAPREALLLRGGDLPIIVSTEGRPVHQAWLYFRVGGSAWSRVGLRPPFHHRLQNLAENAEFYATAGDGQSDHGVARVVDPPAVIGLRLRYRFPEYMARPEQVVTGVSGMLTVPAGTRVELAVTASKPLASGQWSVVSGESGDAGGTSPGTPVRSDGNAPNAPLVVEGATASGSATIWTDTTLGIHLRDKDGFQGQAPRGITFHAVPDEAPEVRLERPSGDLDVVADASVPLRVTAADDHGLRRVWLAYELDRASTASTGRSSQTPSGSSALRSTLNLANGGRTRRGLEVSAHWNLEGLGLRPGDGVVYRAEADDFDNLRGPHTGRSAEQRLRVVERAEMERRLAEGWEEWDRQLAQVIQEQAATRAAVRAARAPEALAEAERRQRDLAARADDLAHRAEALAEMARTNRLAAEQTLARQERAAAALSDIAQRAMPEAADRIRESAAQPERRAEAVTRQEEIERRLQALRRQARPETDLEALARRAEELARAQAELQAQSQRLLPATLGLDIAELSFGQRASLERISHSQSSLQQATGQFEGDLDRAARAVLEQAAAAARVMRERAIPERQGQAARHVTRNALARAATGQQALAADLRQVAALLRQPRDASATTSGARQQAISRARQQLERMLQQHAAVMRRTAARPDAAQSRRLAQQERALRQQAARMDEQLRRSGVPSQSMRSAAQRMAQAARQLQQGSPRQAQSPQQQAQEALREMAQQLQNGQQDRMADAQRQRLRRELGELARRQGSISKTLEGLADGRRQTEDGSKDSPEGMPPDAPVSRPQDHRFAAVPPDSVAAKLAPRQEDVSRSARGLQGRLPSDTFRSAMEQARGAMRRSGEGLRRGVTGAPTRSASRQAEQLLQEMARALDEQRSSTPRGSQQGGGSSGASGQNAQELARRLADLRLLRAMEQGLREETGEANGQAEGPEGRLGDLARRQAQARGMTARAAQGLRRFPGSAGRVAEAAGAMGQAQRGLQSGSAGAETQGAQGTAIMRLTQAIGQGQQQLQAMAQAAGGRPGAPSGPRSNARGNQPALDSVDVRGSDEGGPRALVPSGRRGFGLLSPGDAQALRQGSREKVPADYADLVRRYYRALSERAR